MIQTSDELMVALLDTEKGAAQVQGSIPEKVCVRAPGQITAVDENIDSTLRNEDIINTSEVIENRNIPHSCAVTEDLSLSSLRLYKSM